MSKMRPGGDAIFSPCGTYRYLLQRFWHARLESLCMVMLNPSTADAEKDDPTVARCVERARRLGFGSLEVVNIFALRSTDPKALYRHEDPVGPENDEQIVISARTCNMTICAWGTHGALRERGKRVLQLLRHAGVKPYALRVSAKGHPCHPLYLPYSLQPIVME